MKSNSKSDQREAIFLENVWFDLENIFLFFIDITGNLKQKLFDSIKKVK